MRIKKICIVTGTRAEYNYLKPVIKKAQKSNRLEPKLIVTGMHLLEKYGKSVNLIEKDGIVIDKIIEMYEETDLSKEALGNAVGKVIRKFTQTLVKMAPDLLLVLGDRYEPFAAVIAATTLKIPIAHIHGGDVSATVDENLRHAITKLSHIHFPATPKSAERLQKLGENPKTIHMVGSTTIDNILEDEILPRKELCKQLGLSINDKVVLCLLHPNVYESDDAGNQMHLILKILIDLKMQIVIIYPNNDLGSDLIIQEIELNRNNPNFKIFKNLERNLYLSLLKHAHFMIGNSSSGVIETPYFKLPVVNVGSRNEHRERAGNVINVSFDEHKIRQAIQVVISEEFRNKCQSIFNPYGDGHASDEIIRKLEEIDDFKKYLNKKLTYKFKDP